MSTVWRESQLLIHQHRGRLLLGFFLLIINKACAFVLPLSPGYMIDNVLPNKDTDLLVKLAAVMIGASLVHVVTTYTLSQILGVASQQAINDIRKQVQAHVTRLPVRYFDQNKSGVLISRIMTDAEGIRNLVGNGIVQLAGGLITAVVALALLFYYNFMLTLGVLFMLGVFGIGSAKVFTYVRPMFRKRREINAEVTGRLTESMGGIRVVKAYVAEKREQEVFAEGADRYFSLVAKTITGVSTMASLSIFVLGVISVLITVVGAHAIINGTMTLGEFMNYVGLSAFVAAPVMQISSIGTQISEAFAGLDRIREVLSEPTEFVGEDERQSCRQIDGRVEFDNVRFSYEEGKEVLKGVSLAAPAGSTTALVGSSGSGKSTLVGLIMAYNRPCEGAVLVDGRDLAGLKLKEFRSHLGVVLQDNFLFDGTIEENIRFSRPDASRQDVQRVAKLAHADEFVMGFEDGYGTVVGERGVKLSGGQRQRIAIARALLADPKILILDEATSSLDSESEKMIQDGLRALREGRTTFVIAHRLSTIRSSDQILVLEDGEIVERGTHPELIELDGRYRELHDQQYDYEHERFVNPGEEAEVETVGD
ncbi:MAG: ABC transporter ATP-binding protein [Planctomycetota bacterium]